MDLDEETLRVLAGQPDEFEYFCRLRAQQDGSRRSLHHGGAQWARIKAEQERHDDEKRRIQDLSGGFLTFGPLPTRTFR